MSILDDIRLRGASARITEEMLFAEALREIESGHRRDGLWAKALADCQMQTQQAQARYLKLRVQSLRDEINFLLRESAQNSELKNNNFPNSTEASADKRTTTPSLDPINAQPSEISDLGNKVGKFLMQILIGVFLVYQIYNMIS